MDIHNTIARRIRELRDAKGWSLEALAERSKVSRSNISLIERGQSSPTAVVLDRLATALGVSLASLFEQPESTTTAEPSPRASFSEQSLWTDPESGYIRRNLSPHVPSPLQLVEVRFPPGRQVAYETGLRDADIHQQIWIIEGRMQVTAGNDRWDLETGDCLAMKLDCPIVYRNCSRKPARYLVALSKSLSGGTWSSS
ncbi:XRE family transcriptional regulator [Trinickia caryophylli]|uniref:Transcriptional regulator, XRE family with cupin sensor n=1 Tax=Trinickia caryophylli TaxID=28094 RepID=A0A1X7GKL8_TRICW|nr:XRE family transcriptional regulator [Trinickia caryophylli]PMS09142.1 XRE family transcriptional regulator [Trinickia caryophylli]TRX14985.1 helix-turn-helix domain-containing protein [Trinickia caryophylli]WQE15641.1 XRE family transcriptional regulator [Trinickia caryophylli]SMF71237.1 transcriptional regulator, XRE family with cupin sensor [Trinickia caryophylli]GLU35046.1 transcriptional regulator [Trinickia caryophylli]